MLKKGKKGTRSNGFGNQSGSIQFGETTLALLLFVATLILQKDLGWLQAVVVTVMFFGVLWVIREFLKGQQPPTDPKDQPKSEDPSGKENG